VKALVWYHVNQQHCGLGKSVYFWKVGVNWKENTY